MRDSVRKQFRKWAIGIGCTISVALLLQQARGSETFRSRTANAPSAPEQILSPSVQPNDTPQRETLDTPAESGRGFRFRSQSRQS
ncbi:hypothetical protein D7Z26_19940 [Cohnella endophytica]|uniref:Uncharacterized protein n=1 Tax=Cohnella endophytica TaxID=2419778 RepID=A0A494XH69_9BACL|nr:hypothetical protein [Cohnella endophytica]RKP50085.1 hypothetical protein D7Z26_19940 [Cohnella endophytica]